MHSRIVFFSFLFFPFFFSFLLPWVPLTDFRLPRLPFHISWCIICTMASPCKLRKRRWQFQFDRSPVCTKSVDTASWLLLARCAEQYVQTVPPSSWQIAGDTCRLQTILPPWGGLTGSPWTSSYILCKFHTDKKTCKSPIEREAALFPVPIIQPCAKLYGVPLLRYCGERLDWQSTPEALSLNPAKPVGVFPYYAPP